MPRLCAHAAHSPALLRSRRGPSVAGAMPVLPRTSLSLLLLLCLWTWLCSASLTPPPALSGTAPAFNS
eukprot:396035-Rhodomonas_salina.1